MILQATAAGTMSGAILLFFSHIAPTWSAKNFIRDIDEPRIFGKKKSRREAHLLGAAVHILVAAIAGAGYALLMKASIVTEFSFLSVAGWSLIVGIFIGGVIMPIEGHGIFGVKEDAWFPVDLFLTQLMWAGLFWWIMGLLPVAW
jgi:hypothetical protein